MNVTLNIQTGFAEIKYCYRDSGITSPAKELSTVVEDQADKTPAVTNNSESPESEATLNKQQEAAVDTVPPTVAVDKPEVADSEVSTSVATENNNTSENKVEGSSKVHKKHKKHKKHKHKKQKEST